MPYETRWVPPKLFLEDGGVSVFHAYKNDDIECPMTYWYVVYPGGPEAGDGREFDVRDLVHAGITGSDDHADIIRRAIDFGWIGDAINIPKQKTP